MSEVITSLETDGNNIYQLLQKMHNGTIGSGDFQIINASEFYEGKYAVRADLSDFIDNIEDDIRTNFGVAVRP